MERRSFLRLAGIGLASLAIGLAGGYAIRSPQTIERLITITSTQQTARKVKTLWIYVGPVTDIGWTAAHNEGRIYVERRFNGLVETKFIEKVSEAEARKVIEAELTREKYDAVFATSYGFKYAVKELARDFKDIKFYHCSGEFEEFEDLPNVTTYFAEFYQLYYLNGIAAGAVTETCKVGYVPAFLIPEVIRHINAFALGAVYGAKLMNKCKGGEGLEIYVTSPLGAWFSPDAAANSARYLIERRNVDVIAYTEDTTAVLDVAESYQERGVKVYSFSHYSNMYEYYRKAGKSLKSHLTGQIANWGPIYEYLIARLIANVFIKEDIWARIGDFTQFRWRRSVGKSTAGSPEGAVYLAPLNTEVIPSKALNEIKKLYEDMKEMIFEPFSGPIRGYKVSADGKPQEEPKIKVEAGSRLGRNELWYMDWFYEKIISPA
ncbi:MAG: BMP family ABC transporter substrate-binding protein [Sulfolobales archaeon]